MVMYVQKEIARREPDISPIATSSRRKTRRFDMSWPVVVKGFDQHGKAFQDLCFLKNLSSTGACLALTRSLVVDTIVEIDVCTPLSQKRWLRYFGKVIYVGHQAMPQITGIRFESRRPVFVPPTAILRLHPVKRQNCIIH